MASNSNKVSSDNYGNNEEKMSIGDSIYDMAKYFTELSEWRYLQGNKAVLFHKLVEFSIGSIVQMQS